MISADLAGTEALVRVGRGAAVSEATWLAMRAELGSPGRGVTRELTLPLERFLARRRAVAQIAKRAGVPIGLGAELRELVRRANDDLTGLRKATDQELKPLSPEQLRVRLEGGRFTRELREFQHRDLGHLLCLPHGANFSVPGAGKTTVTYATYEAERVAGRVERMLVIAPLSAFEAWEEEAGEWFSTMLAVQRFDGGAIEADTEVMLANYQRLGSGYEDLAAWITARPSMAVLDEAHRMKRGWAGQWGTACLNLAYLAQRRDILTGTPAPQGPKDFVALLDYLWPGQARRVLPREAVVANPPPSAPKRVAQAIRPLFVRTTKADLKLPPVCHRPVLVPLEGLHRDIYMALRDRYVGQSKMSQKSRADFASMGKVVMYMLEGATNPKLLSAGSLEGSDPDIFRHPPLEIPEGSELAELLARYNDFETPEKFKRLLALVKDNAGAGRKTLVWSNFVRNLELLKEMMGRYRPALIHGGVPQSATVGQPSREHEIARFRRDSECRVLLANPAAMSEGISLHMECHDAIYLERTFNAGQYLQSIDRIHRLGLKPRTKTRITFLITAETVDVTVDRRVRKKAERLGEMLDDPNLPSVALPNDEDYGPPIDDALDVAALFSHLRGEDEDPED